MSKEQALREIDDTFDWLRQMAGEKLAEGQENPDLEAYYRSIEAGSDRAIEEIPVKQIVARVCEAIADHRQQTDATVASFVDALQCLGDRMRLALQHLEAGETDEAEAVLRGEIMALDARFITQSTRGNA